MNRRELVKAGCISALGLHLSGCSRTMETTGPARRIPTLSPVRVSWDRVIRTTVGLRPYRPAGFVVRADRVGEKTVIHNYGHGGAGHSLSWGTGLLATELALGHDTRSVAVIGCGVAGLTTARQLQRHGFAVTIYAESVPPNTTSNKAWASFTPTSGLVAINAATPTWEAQFQRAVRISYDQLQLLTGRDYGISWLYSYSFLDGPPVANTSRAGRNTFVPSDVRTGAQLFAPGEHPFPSPYVQQRPGLRIEPSIYLDALVRDVLMFHGRIQIRKFETPRDLMELEEVLIVNCTGLGSRDLFDDTELVPVKGQLTFLVPQPDVDYATFGGIPDSGGVSRNFGIHMMPRHDGIALGGTSERDVWDLQPNEEARREIVQGHVDLFNGMKTPRSNGPVTRSGVPDQVPPVEAFFGLES